MIKAIIVDDEPNCCETITTLLEDYCPGVEVTGMYNNGSDALSSIQQTPDLFFLMWKCQR